MRAALTLAAIAALVAVLAPRTDCTGKTAAQCERARLIDAGAID